MNLIADLDLALRSLADQLATTGGTFDPVPWVVGGLIALALGAFALVAVNRSRAKKDAELEASRHADAAADRAAERGVGQGDADGDGLVDDSWMTKR